MARYEVQGLTGYVEIPDQPPAPPWGGAANLNPPAHWYANLQGQEQLSGPLTITIPTNGNYIAGYLPIPTSGDRQIVVVSDFTVSVENSTNSTIDLYAQIGVSNPSEVEYPCRPYHGVMHSVSRAKILPGSMQVLSVIRIDVIDLKLTGIPWTMKLGANGQNHPRLAPQVLGPAGTKLCNAAARAVLVG